MYGGGEEKLKKAEIFEHTWMNTGGCSLKAMEASNVTYPNRLYRVHKCLVCKNMRVSSKRWCRGGRGGGEGRIYKRPISGNLLFSITTLFIAGIPSTH